MPYVARRLLKMGNMIVDIKPCKENRDKTIFVFEDTEKLQSDLILAVSHDIKMIELTEEEIKKDIKEDKTMAKTVKKVSFTKGLISREGSDLIIIEIGKDDTKTYNLNKIIDDFVGQEGVSITISIDDDIPADEDN